VSAVGDLVVAPFIYSDMTWPALPERVDDFLPPSGGTSGNGVTDGGQGEAGTRPAGRRHPGAPSRAQVTRTRCWKSLLVPWSGRDVDRATTRPVMAGGEAGATTVAVVGDGAVGLCAVLAARRLGAERIIALSRHAGPAKESPRDFRGHRHHRGPRGEESQPGPVLGPHRGHRPPTAGPGMRGKPPSPSRTRRRDRPFPGSVIGIRRGPARAGAIHRDVLPQCRLARRPGPGPPLHSRNCFGERCWGGTIDPARVLRLRGPIWTTSPTPYQAMDERRAVKSLIPDRSNCDDRSKPGGRLARRTRSTKSGGRSGGRAWPSPAAPDGSLPPVS